MWRLRASSVSVVSPARSLSANSVRSHSSPCTVLSGPQVASCADDSANASVTSSPSRWAISSASCTSSEPARQAVGPVQRRRQRAEQPHAQRVVAGADAIERLDEQRDVGARR